MRRQKMESVYARRLARAHPTPAHTDTHVFSNLDDDSIGKAILALSRAMYNSSASARTRVSVLIAENLGNVRLVLEYGAKHNIIGAGFVWLNVDGNNMQNVVATGDMSPELIRSFAGWLNM